MKKSNMLTNARAKDAFVLALHRRAAPSKRLAPGSLHRENTTDEKWRSHRRESRGIAARDGVDAKRALGRRNERCSDAEENHREEISASSDSHSAKRDSSFVTSAFSSSAISSMRAFGVFS